jgi:hypothetical protein
VCAYGEVRASAHLLRRLQQAEQAEQENKQSMQSKSKHTASKDKQRVEGKKK